MGGDPELLRLRALAKSAEDRYWRLRMNIGDSALLAAAREMWTEAVESARRYEQDHKAGQQNVNRTGPMSKTASGSV